MAEAKNKASEGANVVPAHGDHDRVVMLSLKHDGTPDQAAPEIIGDKDVALAAAREQFRQQAVSAADVDKRGVSASSPALVGKEDGSVEEVDAGSLPQDPSVAELEKAHDQAAKAAESAADKAVGALHKGLGD
jgi:hypothetical protein